MLVLLLSVFTYYCEKLLRITFYDSHLFLIILLLNFYVPQVEYGKDFKIKDKKGTTVSNLYLFKRV